LYQAVIGIGLLPANLIFGLLYQYFGAGYAFTMGAILALLAVGLLPREQHQAEGPRSGVPPSLLLT